MSWSADTDAVLRAEWAAGTTTLQIAILLGVTKNAVVGRVNRLRLTPRENPVHRADPLRTRLPRPPAATTPPVPAPRAATTGCCRYPLWPHRARPPQPALFCDAPSLPGRSWCARHFDVVHLRPTAGAA